VTIEGDPSVNICTAAAVLRPARLVLSVGDASVSVANHAAAAT
jgi:hypothetical protein